MINNHFLLCITARKWFSKASFMEIEQFACWEDKPNYPGSRQSGGKITSAPLNSIKQTALWDTHSIEWERIGWAKIDRQTGKLESSTFRTAFFGMPSFHRLGRQSVGFNHKHVHTWAATGATILPPNPFCHFSRNCIIFINKSSTWAAFFALVTLPGMAMGGKMGNFAFPGQ